LSQIPKKKFLILTSLTTSLESACLISLAQVIFRMSFNQKNKPKWPKLSKKERESKRRSKRRKDLPSFKPKKDLTLHKLKVALMMSLRLWLAILQMRLVIQTMTESSKQLTRKFKQN